MKFYNVPLYAKKINIIFFSHFGFLIFRFPRFFNFKLQRKRQEEVEREIARERRRKKVVKRKRETALVSWMGETYLR